MIVTINLVTKIDMMNKKEKNKMIVIMKIQIKEIKIFDLLTTSMFIILVI